MKLTRNALVIFTVQGGPPPSHSSQDENECEYEYDYDDKDYVIIAGYSILGTSSVCPPCRWMAFITFPFSSVIKVIPAVTTFAPDKVTHQVNALMGLQPMLGAETSDARLTGYEIHMGRTEFIGPVSPAFKIVQRSGEIVAFDDGFVSPDGLVMGTYIHGIFENDGYRRSLLDALRQRKGLPVLAGEVVSYLERKEAAYDRLAELVRENLDMEHVRRVMGLKP